MQKGREVVMEYSRRFFQYCKFLADVGLELFVGATLLLLIMAMLLVGVLVFVWFFQFMMGIIS